MEMNQHDEIVPAVRQCAPLVGDEPVMQDGVEHWCSSRAGGVESWLIRTVCNALVHDVLQTILEVETADYLGDECHSAVPEL
jgi:hypothetical protein